MPTPRRDFTALYSKIFDFFVETAHQRKARPNTIGFREYLGISSGKWTAWSKGQWPNAEDMMKLHEKFGFSYSWLVTGEGEPWEGSQATPDALETSLKSQPDSLALDYIKELKRDKARLLEENAMLRTRVAELEGGKPCEPPAMDGGVAFGAPLGGRV